MLSTFVSQANTFLADRITRPDSSISADQNKITIITDEETANKDVV